MNTPTVRLETIDPPTASAYLAANHPKNRRVSKSAVQALVAEIQAGNWKVTGDTVKFDTEGFLIDGQHRLLAILQSEVPCELFVANKVDTDSYAVLDQGKKRSFSDYLRGLDVENATNVAAAVSLTFRYSTDRQLTAPNHSDKARINMLIDCFNENEDLALWAKTGKQLGHRFQFSPSVWTAFGYLADLTETGDVEGWLHTLHVGANLTSGDPTFALHNVLINRMGKIPDRRYGQDHYTALIIRAWNAHARGNELSALKGPTSGAKMVQIFDPEGKFDQRWPN